MKKEENEIFIERLNKLINENLAMENLSVPFIAESMCMSESTLFRHIKSILGIGVNEYIRNIRLENVVARLTNEMGGGTSIAISNVVFSSGFASLSSFAKAFKKKYGMSATEYIQKITKNAP